MVLRIFGHPGHLSGVQKQIVNVVKNVSKITRLFKGLGVMQSTDKVRHYHRKRGEVMDFYTVVLRRSGSYYVALCLENGIVGQGSTKEGAVEKLREAISSIEELKGTDENIHSQYLSIKELHEFLTVAGTVEALEGMSEPLEMRALYA